MSVANTSDAFTDSRRSDDEGYDVLSDALQFYRISVYSHVVAIVHTLWIYGPLDHQYYRLVSYQIFTFWAGYCEFTFCTAPPIDSELYLD